MMEREVRQIGSRGDWLNWRKQDITASRIAALWDQHPYLTRDQLAASLRADHSAIPNAAMRRGRILEPAVAAALAEDHPDWLITKATTYHRLPEHRIGCTPDYFIGDEGLLQIKTVSPTEWDNWRGKVPMAYTLQTLTELMVTGRTVGILAVMVCSSSFPVHELPVPRHEGAERKILDAVAEWWRQWDAGEIAAPLPSDELAAMVDDGSHVDLSADNLLPGLLLERAKLKEWIGGREKRLSEIDAELKAKVGAARTAWLPGWSISYATQHRKETVIPAKDVRVLRVKALEEADGE